MTAPSTDDLTRLLSECTPGPWKADRKPCFGDIYVRADPPNWNGRGHKWLADVNAGMGRGNADLIAAAPAIAADLISLRKAAEGMAEALRGVSESATDHEQGYISQMEISVTAVDRCAAALAAYEATK